MKLMMSRPRLLLVITSLLLLTACSAQSVLEEVREQPSVQNDADVETQIVTDELSADTPSPEFSENKQPDPKEVRPTPDAKRPLTEIGRYKTLELIFTASRSPDNPFDTYLLKLKITRPDGNEFTIDGFYDGDGHGGQTGHIWKARITPDTIGTWAWQTVPGDVQDDALMGLSGQFEVVESDDLGGVTSDGRYFRFQRGDYIYLVGNFLDFSNRIRTTHTFMSETTTDEQRNAIMARQRDFHAANKANIYFANLGDYNSQSVTPWLGTANNNDKTKMDLARWQAYDAYILDFKESRMLAELWFFADDSNFGALSSAEQKRLFRYALARTSAFNHVMYVIALEWQEGFRRREITEAGNYIQEHNPWERPVSVHSVSLRDWAFAGEGWADFIASQAGNNSLPDTVNSYTIELRLADEIPHLSEEFGFLRSDSDSRLRSNLWATFTGGAAGSGTGSDLKALQRFLEQSRVPFQRLAPHNELVFGGGLSHFVAAEIGHHYVVYSMGGSVSLTVTGNGLMGHWFNPRDPSASLGAPFAVSPGSQQFTPPTNVNEDWVLWISDGSNLNSGIVHPSTGATVTQIVVNLN